MGILYGVNQLRAIGHRFLHTSQVYIPPPARLLITAARTASPEVSVAAVRAAGVDKPGASHIAVRQPVTYQINRYRWSVCCTRGSSVIAEADRFITAIILGHFVSPVIRTNRSGQMVGLPRQVSDTVINAAF